MGCVQVIGERIPKSLRSSVSVSLPVVIMSLYPTDILYFLLAAFDEGMTSGDYAYFGMDTDLGESDIGGVGGE